MQTERNYKNGLEDGVQRYWYDNGQLKTEENYKNGKLDGVRRHWYDNGQLSEEANYKDDELDGVQRTWHENGQLTYEANYKHGQRDGVQRHWCDNGQLRTEENYKDGKLDGVQRFWHNNGQLNIEENYKDDKLDGIRKVWYNDGELKFELNYKNGVIVETDNDIRFRISNASNDIFYSNAERAVENIGQEKATPQQWLAMIEKNGGLKAGEDKWIGLSDWLKEQDQKTLTKQEVIDFIRNNKIQIEETHYSGTAGQELLEEYQPEFTQYYQEAEQEGADDPQEIAWQRMIDEYGDDFGFGFYALGRTLYVNEDSDYFSYLADQEGTDRPINEIRLEYSTKGLENKREIALTVPTIESWNENDWVHFGDADNGRAVAWVRFGDTTIDADATQREAYNKLSSEWNAYRDMLHGKYGDTYSAIAQNATEAELNEYDRLTSALEQARDAYMNNAKQNVLVIDEIQSNRHQQGREKGYQQKGAENATDAIPAAPFEKNWHELAMKRILRFAAENGYNKLAWTTGAQQAIRYDIGRNLESVEKTGEHAYTVRYKEHPARDFEFDENGIFRDEYYPAYYGKTERELFGKEFSEKLAELPVGETIDGNNLMIGGEGMKGFYDDILPRFMQKYGKKWGVQVGEVTMPKLQKGYQTMHAIDINDAMRESVMAGQPMFRIASNENESANAEFNEALEQLTEENADRVTLNLGYPSDILLSAGVADKPMKLYGNKVVKKAKAHGFSISELRNLPEAVANPIAVFNNYQKDANRSVLTELKTKEGNFLVAVNIGKDADIDFNIVASVFGKEGNSIIDWLNNGYATYINKEKALSFLSHHSAPIAETAANAELSRATKVVKDFENPKFDDDIHFSIDGGVEGSVAPEVLPQELVENIAPSESITDFAIRLNATINGYTQERTQQMYDELEKRMRKGGRWYAKLYKHLYDKYRPLDRLQKMLAKQGALLNVQTDAYNDIFRSIGRASTAFEEFYDKQFKPLIHLVRKIEQLDAIKNFNDVRWADGKKMTDHDKLTLYLRAKDMVEAAELGLVERGAEGFADMVRHNGFTRTHTGSWTPQEYVEAFEAALGEPRVNSLWDKVNAINKWSLDYMRNNDFIDDETLERYKDRKFYVPQRGFEEGESKPARNGRGSNNFGSALRKAHGRESLAADPLVYMANIAESTIMATQKNKTKQKMLLFCMANMRLGKETGTFDIAKVQYRKTGRILENGQPEYEPFYGTIPYDELKEDAHNRREIARKKQQLAEAEAMGNVYFQEQLKEDIAALEAKTKYAASVRYDQIRPDTKENISRNRVDVIYKGKKYSLLFADENVAVALNREDPEMGKVTQFLNTTLPFIPATTQYFSRILTQQNPSFALWNLFRDMGLGFHTNLLEHPDWTLAFSKNLVAVQRAVAQKAFANKIDESSKMGKYIQEYFTEGAQTGFSFINSVDDLRKKIAKDLKRSERYADYLDSNLYPFKLFSNITEWSELTVRVAQYVTAREHGYTPEQAATEAKEVSTNFDRKGNLRLLYSLFSFFNAAMQGTNKHIRQVMNGHGVGLALSLALYAGAGLLNTLCMPDDPDDEMGFSEFDRMQNICLGRVRIPLPQGLRGFWALGVQVALAAQGRKTWLAAAVDGASFLAAELGPINPLGGLGVDDATNRLKFNSKLAFREFVPTAAQPFYDVANNTTFNGSTVYRKPYVSSQEGKIPQTNLAKRNVNALLQRATDKWFELGGGDPSKNTLTRSDGTQVRSIFDVNPSKVEYLLKSATGGVGQFAVDLVNTIDNALTDNINSFDDFATTMPVVKRAWKPYKEEKEATRAYWLLKGRVEAASKAATTMPQDRKLIYLKAKNKLEQKSPADLSSKKDLKEMNDIIVEWNKNYW